MLHQCSPRLATNCHSERTNSTTDEALDEVVHGDVREGTNEDGMGDLEVSLCSLNSLKLDVELSGAIP